MIDFFVYCLVSLFFFFYCVLMYDFVIIIIRILSSLLLHKLFLTLTNKKFLNFTRVS